MRPAAKTEGKTWLLAVGGAVAVTLGTLYLFRAPGGTPEPARSPAPALTFRQQTESGGADFYDPTPLFVPTKWNSRPNVLPNDLVREPGDDFRYGAKATPEVDAAGLAFPGNAKIPEKPVEAQNSWTMESQFLGFGQADAKMEPLPSRGAMVQVISASDGRQVFTRILRRENMSAAESGNWQPMEFLAVIEPAGLVGLPSPVPSSNPAEIVAQFQSDLAKVLRVGQPLAPGFYRIKVGP